MKPLEIETFENLAEKLSQSNSPVEIATLIKRLAFTGDTRAIPILKSFLKHEDRRIRANAIEGLGFFADESFIPLLLQHFEIEKDPRSRGNILRILWKFGRERVYSELEKMLFSENLSTVKSAIYVAKQIDTEKTYELVKRLYKQTKDKEVKRIAKESLKKFTSAPPSFLSKLNQPWFIIGALILFSIVIIIYIFNILSYNSHKTNTNISKKSNIKGLINESLKTQNYSLAIEYLNYYLKKKPDDAKAYFLKGKCYLKLQSFDLAIKNFKKAILYNKKLGFSYIYLAKIYAYQGDEASLSKLLSLVKYRFKASIETKFVEIYYFILKGEWGKALKDLKAINSDLLNEDFRGERDRLLKLVNNKINEINLQSPIGAIKRYIKDMEYDKGIEMAKTAMGMQPMKYEYYLLLSELYEKKGDLFKAQQPIIRMINLGLNKPYGYYRLADINLKLSNYSKAYLLCEKALSLDNNIDFLLLKAKIFIKSGAFNKAKRLLEKNRELKMDKNQRLEFVKLYVVVFKFYEDYEKIYTLFKNIKNFSDLLLEKWICEIKTNDVEIISSNLKALKGVENTFEKRNMVYNLTGLYYLRLGQIPYAKKYFERIIKDKTAFDVKPLSWNNLGFCMIMENNRKKAYKYFEVSAHLGDISVAFYNMGCLKYQERDFKRAAVFFKKALKINKYDYRAVNNLALCYINFHEFRKAYLMLKLAINMVKDWKNIPFKLVFNYKAICEQVGEKYEFNFENRIYSEKEKGLLPEVWKSFYYQMASGNAITF